MAKHWTQTKEGKLKMKQIAESRKRKNEALESMSSVPMQVNPEEIAFKRGYESAMNDYKNNRNSAKIALVESISKLNSAAAGLLEFLGER